LILIDELLDKGAYVNAVNYYGDTALMIAAQNGHTKIADQLRGFLRGFTETLNPLFDRELLAEASRKGRAETSASPAPSAAAKTAAKIDNSGQDRKK
jgi:ankyrin repeat protein